MHPGENIFFTWNSAPLLTPPNGSSERRRSAYTSLSSSSAPCISDNEHEKNSSEFFEIDSPSRARWGEEKNSSEFFEIRRIERSEIQGREELIRVLRRCLPCRRTLRFFSCLTSRSMRFDISGSGPSEWFLLSNKRDDKRKSFQKLQTGSLLYYR